MSFCLQTVPQITARDHLNMENHNKSPMRRQQLNRQKEQTQNISSPLRPRAQSAYIPVTPCFNPLGSQQPEIQTNSALFSSQFLQSPPGALGTPGINNNYFNPKNRKHSDNTVGYQHAKNNHMNKSVIFDRGEQNLHRDSKPLAKFQEKSRKISCNLDTGIFWKKLGKKNSQNEDCPQTKCKHQENTPKITKKKVKSWDQVNNFQFESNRSSSDQNKPNVHVQSPLIHKAANLRKHSDNENIKKIPSFLTNMKFHRNSVDNVEFLLRTNWGIDNFCVVRELGKGTFGKVIMAIEKETHLVYAIKILSKNAIREDNMMEQLIRQLKIQMHINHPNIIKVYGFFDDLLYFYIIMECAFDGQLSEYMRKSSQPLPEVTATHMFSQICSAVSLLHSQKIIHRDLKPENIMLHQGVVKICDFGWSVYRGGTLRSTFCGTPIYLCPQILVGDEYDESIDIWALGVILYEMLFKNNPFRITCKQELINILNEPIHYDEHTKVSEAAKDIITLCLSKRAIDRPNIRQLLLHEFLLNLQNNEDKR